MSLNNENGIKKEEMDEGTLAKIDNLVQNISMDIRKNNRDWLKGEGKCEVCGLRFAEINLNLEYGSHRECRLCWDD